MPTWTPSRITNPFFSIALEPAHGGRIVSLEVPSGNLTTGAVSADLGRARVPERFGLLSVQLWQESYWHGDLCHAEWPIVSTSATPTQVIVSLSRQSALWPGVSVERNVIVTDDPWIDVRHELDPGPSVGTIGVQGKSYSAPAFWFSSVLRGRGRTFVPSPVGVLDLPRRPEDQSWCHEPADGWIAWLDREGGLAFVTESAQLRHVRVVHRRTDRVEWIRRRVATKERANVRLIPFTGLSHVNGVGDAGIVALETVEPRPQWFNLPPRKRLEVHLYALRSGVFDIEVEVIDGAGGTVESLHLSTATLTAGSVHRVPILTPSDTASGWRGRLTLGIPGRRFTTDFMGPASGAYSTGSRLVGFLPSASHASELPRPRANGRWAPQRFVFDAAPVPLPEPWIPRNTERRLRVLALTYQRAGESTIALAQSFDLDLTLLYVPPKATMPTGNDGITTQLFEHLLGDRYQGFTGAEVIAAWRAALDSRREYDVILLEIGASNAPPPAPATARLEEEGWALLPADLQANILARVHAGTGLFCVRRGDSAGPTQETAILTGLLPLINTSPSDFRAAWGPSIDPTVRGLPWNVMAPPGRIMNYSLRSGAHTLIKTPGSEPMPFAARTTYGSGRVVELAWGRYPVPEDRYRERRQETEGMDTLRYDQALLARFLYDAAGCVPPIQVREVLVQDNQVTVHLDATAQPAPAFTLDWIARDRFGVVLGRRQETSPNFPSNGLVIAIPSGAWTVDVTVMPEGGQPAWGAGGRTLHVDVQVSPVLGVMGPADEVRVTPAVVDQASLIVIDTVDGRGRAVQRTEVRPGRASAPIGARALETPHGELRVHAINAQGELLAQGFRRFRVRRRSGGEGWPVIFWNRELGLPRPLLVRHLDASASLGVGALFDMGGDKTVENDLLRAADHLDVPYGVSIKWIVASGGTAPDGTTAGTFSLTNWSDIATMRDNATRIARNLADCNVLFYALGADEPVPPRPDASHDRETVARFRDWLHERYGHMDASLQREWGPSYSLASVVPTSHEAAQANMNQPASPLQPTRTYAPWLDFRRFIMELFSSNPALAREALRAGDPEARTNTSGENVMSHLSGRDWWVRGRALDVVGRYFTSLAFELAALKTPSMMWTGYDDPDPYIRYRIFRAFGLRESGLQLYKEMSLVNPDLSLPEGGRDLAAALLPARRGVGGLFMASRPAEDGVYVLSSPDSSCVLAVHGYERLGELWVHGTEVLPPANLGFNAREGAHELLSAMGVGWRSIAPQEIEAGELDRRRARLLILPMCAALSDVVCDAIERWVRRGGCLIADLMPGIFTAHGRLRGTGIAGDGELEGSSNPLDEVFGLKPGAKPAIADSTVSVGGAPGFRVRCADTALRYAVTAPVASPSAVPGGTATGTASGSSSEPVWMLYGHGQGRAAYLGCSLFADYNDVLSRPRVELTRMEAAFSRLLGSLGATERVTISDSATQERAPLCQFHVREIEQGELVVLQRNPLGISAPVEPEIAAELDFKSPAHTYDIEAGAYLGYGARLPIHLSAYTHRAFARLPGRILGVDLNVEPGAALGARVVLTAVVRADDPLACKHYLRLDVIDQDGRTIRYLAREAMTECGSATFTIQTALNDPSGTWTFVVAHVATGVEGRLDVAMGARAGMVRLPEPFLIEAIDD
jgi:hypothetical protein